MTLTLVCLYAANVLYLICYIVRDVLMLRILAVVAMITFMPYYVFHHAEMSSPDGLHQTDAGFWNVSLSPAEPMVEPVLWNLGFIAINLFWIVLIFRERQPPKLSDDEKMLYDLTFKNVCGERDMLRLLKRAQWEEIQAGELLIRGNTRPERLILIHSGHASVTVEGEELARLRPGDLAGEMSFLTGAKSVADVVAEEPIRFVIWQRAELLSLFEKRSELKTAIYGLIGHDLVTKLSSSQPKIPEFSVSSKSRGGSMIPSAGNEVE